MNVTRNGSLRYELVWVTRDRALRGLPGLAWHLLAGFSLVPAWLLSRKAERRRKIELRFFEHSLAAIGVKIEVVGEPIRGNGTLYLANHISFTDVLALAKLLNARFVAKSEVRRWRLLGRWAERMEALFVDRDARGDAPHQISHLTAALRAGDSLILFPEGTTSDGDDVLPFRSALLAAAMVASRVQPIALSYSDGRRRAYIGTETLGANLLRLAPYRTCLRVEFLAALPAELHADRKQLARAARAAIRAARAPEQQATRPPCADGQRAPAE